MAGESNKKKISKKLKPKRITTKPTGALAQKQKRKKVGRPSLTDIMKEDMLQTKNKFLLKVQLVNDKFSSSSVTWKDIQTVFTQLGLQGVSNTKNAINDVFKRLNKTRYPSREMHEAMKTALANYPENKEKFRTAHAQSFGTSSELKTTMTTGSQRLAQIQHQKTKFQTRFISLDIQAERYTTTESNKVGEIISISGDEGDKDSYNEAEALIGEELPEALFDDVLSEPEVLPEPEKGSTAEV